MNWQLRDVDAVNFCRSRTMIDVHYEADPKLSTTLQQVIEGLSVICDPGHIVAALLYLYLLDCTNVGSIPLTTVGASI